MIAEIIEFNEETRNTHKTWKQKEFNVIKMVEESVDILFFYLQLVNFLGKEDERIIEILNMAWEECWKEVDEYRDTVADIELELIKNLSDMEWCLALPKCLNIMGLLVNLYINNELKYEYTGGENLQFYIYDFNKFDKIKELCITSGNDSRNYETNIFMYNKDNSNNFTIKGKLINNDEKVGVIKVAHASTEDSPIFENFSKILGGEHIDIEYNYKRIQACEVLDEEKKEVNVSGNSKEKEYIAQEEIVVYETNKGNVKAYTLSKGDKVKLRSLYSYEQDKYIKVVNEEGRYGWIKLEDNQILE